MKTVQILEDDDLILPDDHVRQLQFQYEGQSDYLERNATYGGGAINRLRWMPARVYCPAWVGRKVKDFEKAVHGLSHEFVRGELPKKHLEKLTREERGLYDE